VPVPVPDLDANDPLAARAGQAGDRLVQPSDGRSRQAPGRESSRVELRCDAEIGDQLDRSLGAGERPRADLLTEIEGQREAERDDRDSAGDRETGEQAEMEMGSMKAGQGGRSWERSPP
jgi:hypothetical protein